MQFHYVVVYNTKTKKWCVESDSSSYFPDGHVWDDDQYEKESWGWTEPLVGTPEDALDMQLVHMLEWLIDTGPTPEEV